MFILFPVPSTPTPYVIKEVRVAPEESYLVMYVIIPVVVAVLVIVVCVVCCCYCRSTHNMKMSGGDALVENLLENDLYKHLPNGGFVIHVDPRFEIPRAS